MTWKKLWCCSRHLWEMSYCLSPSPPQTPLFPPPPFLPLSRESEIRRENWLISFSLFFVSSDSGSAPGGPSTRPTKCRTTRSTENSKHEEENEGGKRRVGYLFSKYSVSDLHSFEVKGGAAYLWYPLWTGLLPLLRNEHSFENLRFPTPLKILFFIFIF